MEVEDKKIQLLSQEKAKLLISDFERILGYGAKSAFFQELSDFYGREPFTYKTFDNWITGKTDEMQAQNFLIVSNYLKSDSFRSVVPWSAGIDEECDIAKEKSSLDEDREVIRKRLSIATEKIQGKEKFDADLFDLFTGYWTHSELSFLGRNKRTNSSCYAAIQAFPNEEIAKIVIAIFYSKSIRVETGLFGTGDIFIGEGERLCHGKTWSRNNPMGYTDFDLSFSCCGSVFLATS